MRELQIDGTRILIADDAYKGRTAEDVAEDVRNLSRRLLEYAKAAKLE